MVVMSTTFNESTDTWFSDMSEVAKDLQYKNKILNVIKYVPNKNNLLKLKALLRAEQTYIMERTDSNAETDKTFIALDNCIKTIDLCMDGEFRKEFRYQYHKTLNIKGGYMVSVTSEFFSLLKQSLTYYHGDEDSEFGWK